MMNYEVIRLERLLASGLFFKARARIFNNQFSMINAQEGERDNGDDPPSLKLRRTKGNIGFRRNQVEEAFFGGTFFRRL
jgi:hypothetical protein